MRKRLTLAAMLVMIAACYIPLAPPAGGTVETAIIAQGKEKDKAKEKDLKKEKGKKVKEKKDKKGKDKKGKDKKGKNKEEEDPSTGSGNAALIALGVGGAMLLGGGLMVHRIFRQPTHPPENGGGG